MRRPFILAALTILVTLSSCSLLDVFQGTPGTDGTQWFTGTAGPEADIGSAIPGSLYLNTSNGDVYRYENETWLFVMTIQGQMGADGATWYSGSGAPGAGTGDDGDMYLDTSSGDVYEKIAGSWSFSLNVQGRLQYNVTIRVRSNGNPIANTTILSDAVKQGSTDANGLLTVSYSTAIAVTISAQKTFFNTASTGLSPDIADGTIVDIELAPQIFIADLGRGAGIAGKIIKIDDMTGAGRTEVTDIGAYTLRGPSRVNVDYDRGFMIIADNDYDNDIDPVVLIKATDFPPPAASVTFQPLGDAEMRFVSQILIYSDDTLVLSDSHLSGGRVAVLNGFPDFSGGSGIGGLTSYADLIGRFSNGVARSNDGRIILSGLDTSVNRRIELAQTVSQNETPVDFATVTVQFTPLDFNFPGPMVLSSDGAYLYVSDIGNTMDQSPTVSGLIRYDLTDPANAAAVRYYDGSDSTSGAFKNPHILGILPDGRLYVADVGLALDDLDDRIVRVDLTAFDAVPVSNVVEYKPVGAEQFYFDFPELGAF